MHRDDSNDELIRQLQNHALARSRERRNAITDPRKEAQKKCAELFLQPNLSPEQLALRELLEMVIAETDTRIERFTFHSQQKRTREIGQRLHNLGGFKLMKHIWEQVPRNDRDSLAHVWSGVGEWYCL